MFDLKEFIAELEEITAIESGTGCVDGQREVAEYFKARFDALGWKSTLHDIGDATGPMLSCVNREAESYDLMMIGHIDTVFPRGMLEKNPFRIEDNKIYGLGVADMKQGALMMYHIVKNLDKEVLDKINIAVVFNPDEEIGSTYSKPAYKSIAEKSKYCYIYEASSILGHRTIKRKGSFGLEAQFYGVKGHSGYVFTNGAKSAVHEMAHWIVEFCKLEDRERDITVNAGIANGGSAINIVADHASLALGIRFFDIEVKNEILAKLKELEGHAEEKGIKVTYTKNRFTSPLVPTKDGLSYAEHAEKIAKAIDPDFHYKAVPGLSDGNQIADLGPIVIDSLGPAGTKVHTENEHLLIDKIEISYKVSEALIKDIAENKKL
ncbi:MAG: M20/M25/M40 family metallo-hydrolase [Clostridia bacterium]|nr:M20/M25/M40 family metallo-hydrolase [Clostridia bacterium]